MSSGFLTKEITQKITRQGPISFCDFMEMCLYYPDHGYYTSYSEKIGTSGDYFTSPYATAIFGEMLGKQLEEMWVFLGRKKFTIVEYGAGPGILCRDILQRIKSTSEQFYAELNYCIIEKSTVMRARELENIPQQFINDKKVTWLNSIDDLRDLNGCILSNEVVDNFSVHVVVMKEELNEVFVEYDAEKKSFAEVLRPAGWELKNYLREMKINLPYGFRTEINLQALQWMKEIAAKLEKGFVLTIDYGHPASVLYNEKRRTGTLLCYHKHKINTQPFSNIGEQDITAHVNFTALNHWGERYGLQCSGFTNQALFLKSLGLASHLRNMEEREKAKPLYIKEKIFMLHTFLMDMGSKFKVLIQHKGIKNPLLSGLAFSQRAVV